MHWWTLLAACGLTTAASGAALWALIRAAPHLGLIDHPDARKRHLGDVPVVGGIAILVGVLAGSLWADGLTRFDRLLLATATALMIVGIVDDRRNLRVRVRVVLQVAIIAVMVVFGGVHVQTLGSLFGVESQLGWFAIPFTIVAVIGLLNAFNLIDGIDGLAGSVTLIGIAGVLLASRVAMAHGITLILVLTACALVPFLAARAGSASATAVSWATPAARCSGTCWAGR